jgi:Fic family protein
VASLLSDVPGRLSAEPFSEALVLSFHSRLAAPRKDGREEAGRYKGSSPPSPFLRWGLEPEALRSPGWHLVPREMERLVAWTVRSLDPASPYHPLLVIPAFLLEFQALRPFANGNGRTARALASFLLLRHVHPGVLHVSLDAIVAERYYDLLLALRKSQATRNLPRPDLVPWLEAFLSLLEEHGRRLRRLGEGSVREEELTATQGRVLSMAQAGETVTTGSVAEALGVSRETAKLSLGRLHAAGMLERLGAGRGCRYRAVRPGG